MPLQLLTTPRLAPSRFPSSSPQPAFAPVCILGLTSHGLEYPLGRFGSALLARSSPSFSCCSSLLAGRA